DERADTEERMEAVDQRRRLGQVAEEHVERGLDEADAEAHHDLDQHERDEGRPYGDREAAEDAGTGPQHQGEAHPEAVQELTRDGSGQHETSREGEERQADRGLADVVVAELYDEQYAAD